jgi:hypothetical protein
LNNGTNFRAQLGISNEYVRYCREERNFAAVLYHLLLDENRLGAFLRLIGVSARDVDKVGVYFEYAHLRDLWSFVAKSETNVAAQNQRYRDAVIAMLQMRPGRALPTDTRLFNEFFIGEGSRAASVTYIQMPSRWNDAQFQRWVEFDDEDFARRACKLKWAFNAKPDLVLHLGPDKVVCIEAKLGSGIGAYRAKTGDPKCFGMTQTKLQEFILQDLLGYETDETSFVMISKTKGAPTKPWRNFTWHEVFEAVLNAHPPAAGESWMVAEFRNRFVQPA